MPGTRHLAADISAVVAAMDSCVNIRLTAMAPRAKPARFARLLTNQTT
jgi:hypothetical protein